MKSKKLVTLPFGSFESNGVELNNTFGKDSFNFDIFIFIRMLIWSLKCTKINYLKPDYEVNKLKVRKGEECYCNLASPQT